MRFEVEKWRGREVCEVDEEDRKRSRETEE